MASGGNHAAHPTHRPRPRASRLEERTQVTPSEIDEASGARTYYLASERAEVDAFDVMLDDIDPDWHEHLTRTGP